MKVKKLALIVLLAGLVLAVSGCGKGKVKKIYHYTSKSYVISYPIKSLGLNDDISGSFRGAFSIGFGGLDTNTYYYVYAGAGDGRYILKKYDAEKTYIEETSGQPRFEKVIKYVVVDNDADGFTVDGSKPIGNGLFGAYGGGFTVGNVEYAIYDSDFNNNYDIVAQHVKVGESQTLYVSTESTSTLYVPKGTIKVKFNADVNNVK